MDSHRYAHTQKYTHTVTVLYRNGKEVLFTGSTLSLKYEEFKYSRLTGTKNCAINETVHTHK